MTDRTYPLFSVFAFFGFILPLIPLAWHLQALNSGTCFFIFWSSLACLNQFVNSVVWAGNALNPAPIWCEISIRIILASGVGIPAASLCINRRLYHIASIQTGSITPAEKRRGIIIDSLICLLFPLLYTALQYVVQGHRFNILEDIGCFPALYNTLLTFFISNMWPIFLGLISATYCVLSLRAFARRRAEFGRFLSSNTTLTVSRYFRLMALAMTEICATTPLAIFTIWVNATGTPVGPWRSWSDTHFNYSRVEQFPALIWRSDRVAAMGIEFTRWAAPICAFIFFSFFGFAHESMKNYKLAWKWITKSLGVPSPEMTGQAQKPQALFYSKRDVSPTLHSFALDDLKRTDSIISDVSTSMPKKGFLLESQSSSVGQSGIIAVAINPLRPSYPLSDPIPLTRARTL